MKRDTRSIVALSLSAAALLGANLLRAETYVVDGKASEIRWVGKKVTGQHNGTIRVKTGQVEVKNGAATSGTVTIDMTSIQVLDLKDPGTNAKLANHLKSDDFFGVEKHPAATFKIAEIRPIADAKPGEPNATVKGSLTIKGATHPSEFPATITVSGANAKASAKGVKVDRTLYDVRYGSGKFFQDLGNKMIDDEFTIDFDIVAKKK